MCLTFVVPAKAGTHNHKCFLEQKLSATVPNREAPAYGSLLSQGRQRTVRGVSLRHRPRARAAHAGTTRVAAPVALPRRWKYLVAEGRRFGEPHDNEAASH